MMEKVNIAALIKELNNADVKKPEVSSTKKLTEAKDVEAQLSGRGMGQLGSILIIEGEAASFLCKGFNIPDTWKLVELGHLYAAYDGERLSIFENKMDFTDELNDDDDFND